MRRRVALGSGLLLALVALLWSTRPGGAPGDPAAEDGPRTRRIVDASADGRDHGVPADPTLDPAHLDGSSDAAASAGGNGDEGPDGELTDEALDLREAELLASPHTQVVCDLALDVRHGSAYLAIGGDSAMNGRMVEVVRGRAYMPLVYDLGELGDATFTERSGVFSLEGYGPTAVSWGDPGEDGRGRCSAPIAPEAGRASLTGTLTVSPSGAPAAGGWVEGCGNLAFADERGVVHMDIVSTPCTVIAMRQDGMLRTMSVPVEVVPRPGQDVVVDLVIPEAPRAGLGLQISATDGGILVEGVVEGGPASQAGLQEGDLVVAIDGAPAGDLTLPELVEQAGGEPGSDVALEVLRDGERIAITVTRDVLPG